jgi:hypothetical protein
MRRGGGRIQLVYVGKEDNFLTGNPKVSFFRFVYRQHTNFAIENIEQVFEQAENLTTTAPLQDNILPTTEPVEIKS